MRMLHPDPGHELTYNDVFMVPSLSDVASRMSVDLATPDGIGTTIPIVVANMTAVAGRRMAETIARRGGVAILPQDIPTDVVGAVIEYVKRCHPVFETPITLRPDETIGDALSLIHKRAHGAVVIVDADHRPLGVFTEKDADGFDRFTQLANVMSSSLHLLDADVEPEQAHAVLGERRLHVAPVVGDDGRLPRRADAEGARCGRRSIDRRSMPTDGSWSAWPSGSTAIQPLGRVSSRRTAPTCWSSTRPTAIRRAR